jgi:two-component system chemotaxis response regulator CheB
MSTGNGGETAPGDGAPWLVVMAASAGGIKALRTILGDLPADFPAAIVIVQHRPPNRDGYLDDVLRSRARLPVTVAAQGEAIRPGRIYLARPDSHVTITPERSLVYRDGTMIRFVQSSANPLFETAGTAFDGHVVAVVLSGFGRDATDGVQGVKANGGTVIAQDQATSEHWGMPSSAIATGAVDYVLPVEAIAPTLDSLVRGRSIAPA